MPHIRMRYALDPLLSKLKYSPVVAIQGVRQCGKSTLARDILTKKISRSVYRTLDSPNVLDSIQIRPETFLESLSGEGLVIIDEAQKAPVLFGAIKAKVDSSRKPGQYLLLGSTEFSKAMKIREALTGRLSRLRLFPMLTSEAFKASLIKIPSTPFFLTSSKNTWLKRRELVQFLSKGGMPAFFATRNNDERLAQIQDWLALTVERDASLIPAKKINSDHLRRVLQEIAVHAEPESGRIAKSLRLSTQKVKSLIEVLKILFVVHEIHPHPSGSGKPRYYLCDPALATALGASFEKQLETWFYLEQVAKLSYSGLASEVHFSYYRSSKGSIVQGVWERHLRGSKELSFLKLSPQESIDLRELNILESLLQKHPEASAHLICGGSDSQKHGPISISPWESLA